MAEIITQDDGALTEEAVVQFLQQALQALDVEGRRLLVLVPDATRTMPLPMVYKTLTETLDSRTAQLDFMIALGTHPPMTDKQLSRHFGQTVQDGRIGAHCIHNHAWDDPDALAAIGLITADEMYALSRGKMKEDLVVRINRRIFDYDHLLICGPVFPHEVVGFSGGNKYFFPGISGPEVIDISHWLGALLTNYAVIGSGYTPVRAVIDRAAEMIPKPKSCFAFVLDEAGTYGVFSGTPEIAWEGASALSAERHIITTGRTYERVLSVMPEMYDDLWVGGKGMYKVEPIVADGGEVIIYAPHIKEISYTHGEVLREIGYHVSDYFVKQWDRFKGYPWSELAHSTHVRGLGSYDPETGVETPRIHVTLATGIPEETCQAINLGYRDPAGIDPADWTGREEEGILVIPNAGEHLYRVQ
jgi:nickel-dependent lactate racemase